MTSLETTFGGRGEAAASAASDSPPKGAFGIGFEDVTVAYRGHVVLKDLTLAANPGEILAIIGPSGSGKTTALRAVAGFVRPVKGRVSIGERDVTDLPPRERDLGMVVQNYALFPHMRVSENVAFGLRARKAPDETVHRRVKECLAMVDMLDYLERYPRQLSGGQQQRVAIARALAIRPSVLLLDEPLSALDAQIRRNMVEEIAQLHRELPDLTVLYVTHDQTEALTLANRIAIMRDGRLVALGSGHDLYRNPPNRFTADFLGRANLLPVTVEGVEKGGKLARVRFGETGLKARARPGLQTGGRALLCVRPHDLSLAKPGRGGNTLSGEVETALWQGDQHSIALTVADQSVRITSAPLDTPPPLGARITVSFPADSASLIEDDDD